MQYMLRMSSLIFSPRIYEAVFQFSAYLYWKCIIQQQQGSCNNTLWSHISTPACEISHGYMSISFWHKVTPETVEETFRIYHKNVTLLLQQDLLSKFYLFTN